jgi:osmoprotectant transport system permease protein
MSDFVDGIRWVTDGGNWWGPNGIAARLVEHLWYSLLATALAALVGIPVGLWVGHTGHGRWITANVTNVLRAVPTVGVVTLLFVWRPLTLWPVLVALTVLALPAVVLNTVAGVDSIEPTTRVAAQACGYRASQQVLGVELPCALPLVLAGVRSAANQVIATATVAGFFGLGGLGRFLFTGYGTQRYDIVWGATVLVIALVLLVEAVFAVLQRTLVSPGVRPATAT